MHCSFPKSFSVFPAPVYLGISPGTVCLGYFITPAQLKVLGVPRTVLGIVEQEGTAFLGGKGSHCLVLPLGSILGKCSAAFCFLG